MAIKIVSWNVEGRLTAYEKSQRGTPTQILAEIKRLGADIVVLPEAYLDEPSPDVDSKLRAMGYRWYDTKYKDTLHDDDVAKWGWPHMRVLYRIPVSNIETKRWGELRDLPVLVVQDPATKKEICIIATHLDDINEGRRLLQLDEIIPFIKRSKLPIIMLGDFNAMWHKGRARLVGSRVFQVLVRLLPKNAQSFARRASRMAEGSVMTKLQSAGLTDADPYLLPTVTPKNRNLSWLPSVRLIQIDHILYSKNIDARSFRIEKDGGSDHRAISAVLTLN